MSTLNNKTESTSQTALQRYNATIARATAIMNKAQLDNKISFEKRKNIYNKYEKELRQAKSKRNDLYKKAIQIRYFLDRGYSKTEVGKFMYYKNKKTHREACYTADQVSNFMYNNADIMQIVTDRLAEIGGSYSLVSDYLISNHPDPLFDGLAHDKDGLNPVIVYALDLCQREIQYVRRMCILDEIEAKYSRNKTGLPREIEIQTAIDLYKQIKQHPFIITNATVCQMYKARIESADRLIQINLGGDIINKVLDNEDKVFMTYPYKGKALEKIFSQASKPAKIPKVNRENQLAITILKMHGLNKSDIQTITNASDDDIRTYQSKSSDHYKYIEELVRECGGLDALYKAEIEMDYTGLPVQLWKMRDTQIILDILYKYRNILKNALA